MQNELKKNIIAGTFVMEGLFCKAEKKKFVYTYDSISDSERIKPAANIVYTPRQLRWQQHKLNGYYHFGVNTFIDEERGNGKEDTKKLNPASLDANHWIKNANQVGIKQVILIAKHHYGFCLWPTSTTEHSVKNSSWKKANEGTTIGYKLLLDFDAAIAKNVRLIILFSRLNPFIVEFGLYK